MNTVRFHDLFDLEMVDIQDAAAMLAQDSAPIGDLAANQGRTKTSGGPLPAGLWTL